MTSGTGQMLAWYRSRAKFGFAWLLLVAAALSMRVLIPQGYMAESTSPGTLTVTVCHSDAVLRIPVEKKAPDRERRDQQPCAFAKLAVGDAPGPDAAPLPLPPAVAASFAVHEAPFALASAARQLPPSRGPPLFA